MCAAVDGLQFWIEFVKVVHGLSVSCKELLLLNGDEAPSRFRLRSPLELPTAADPAAKIAEKVAQNLSLVAGELGEKCAEHRRMAHFHHDDGLAHRGAPAQFSPSRHQTIQYHGVFVGLCGERFRVSPGSDSPAQTSELRISADHPSKPPHFGKVMSGRPAAM